MGQANSMNQQRCFEKRHLASRNPGYGKRLMLSLSLSLQQQLNSTYDKETHSAVRYLNRKKNQKKKPATAKTATQHSSIILSVPNPRPCSPKASPPHPTPKQGLWLCSSSSWYHLCDTQPGLAGETLAYRFVRALLRWDAWSIMPVSMPHAFDVVTPLLSPP